MTMRSGKHHNLLPIIILTIIMGKHTVSAQGLGIRGQFSGWTLANMDRLDESQVGLRYIPEFTTTLPVSDGWTLDGEYSINAYGLGLFQGWGNFETEGKIKSYRAWLRLASNQFEARIGLQKINFGSAGLLRSLMWFDRIDPRDPLQLTDGVWALLLRYFFLNNANIWLWGLYGNDEVKGWEFIPTVKNNIEFGGRIQVPVPLGELGLSYHHRKADVNRGIDQLLPMLGLTGTEDPSPFDLIDLGTVPENRYGIDAKWDIEIGVWVEAVLFHHKMDLFPYEYQRMITLGADYTLPLGNGLHVMLEHFTFDLTEKPFDKGEGMAFTALSLNYPLGLTDTITGMIFYDSENKDWYRFINWQRTFDAWSMYIMAFWNPDQFQLYQTMSGGSLFSGKGFQFMVVFNH